jgi:hypothetical protein
MENLAIKNALHPPTGKRAKATAAKYEKVLENMPVGNAPRGYNKDKALQRKEEEAAALAVLKKNGIDLSEPASLLDKKQNAERLLSKKRKSKSKSPLPPEPLPSDQSFSVLGDDLTPIMELFSGYQFKFANPSSICPKPKKTPINVARFLEIIYLTGNLSGACKAISVSFETINKWRRDDPVFAAAMDEAIERHKDVIEDAIHQRGIVGVEKPVFQGGKLVGYQREYSDSLLLAKAKAYIPEKYGDRLRVEQDTSVKVEIPKEIADLIAMVSRPAPIDITPKPKQIEHNNSNHDAE